MYFALNKISNRRFLGNEEVVQTNLASDNLIENRFMIQYDFDIFLWNKMQFLKIYSSDPDRNKTATSLLKPIQWKKACNNNIEKWTSQGAFHKLNRGISTNLRKLKLVWNNYQK